MIDHRSARQGRCRAFAMITHGERRPSLSLTALKERLRNPA